MATAVLRTFEIYQKARVQFVQTVAELARRKENYEALQSAGVLLLLRPLLLDVVPSVSQTACIALARMAEASPQIAEDIIKIDILPDIVDSIAYQNRFFKKCAAFLFKAIARHNKELAQEVVKAGGLQALASILQEFDPAVKEAGCWAISFIAKHNDELATAVTEIISIKDLVLCIQEPELGLRKIAANALMQIARHKPELARKVASDEFALLPFIGPLIQHHDAKLKRQAIACLSHIAFHNQILAELVTQNVKFENLLKNLKDSDKGVRINTAECIKNLVKHKAESAKYICNKDGAKALIEYIKHNDGAAREPALTAISCIASFDEGMAMTIINSDAVPTIRDAMKQEKDANIKLKAAQALGCLGQHTEDHAKVLAEKGVLKELMEIINEENKKKESKSDGQYSQNPNQDLLDACKDAAKKIINNCKSVQALDELIVAESPDQMKTPNEMLILVLKQLLKILPSNNQAKRKFAEGLHKLLLLKEEISKRPNPDKTIESIIDDICKIYPPDLVNYYTPNFEKKMAEKLDKFSQPADV